jgi:hypothetical protein
MQYHHTRKAYFLHGEKSPPAQHEPHKKAKVSTHHLLLLGTTSPRPFRSLDALLIRLDLAPLHGTHEATAGLPRPLELAARGLAEQVDLDKVAFESALDGDDRLDDEWVRVLEVDVHDAHHADAHELRLEEGAQLLRVVGVDGCGDGFGFLSRAHGRGFDVLYDCHICGAVISPIRSPIATRFAKMPSRRTEFHVDLPFFLSICILT